MNSRRVSVLLVEDNPDHVILLERRLTDVGVNVRSASTAKEALDSLEGVDIVLLDYLLPDMNGLEALKEIRERSDASVVMLTGMGSEEVAVRAMRSGAIDYVVKDTNYLRFLPDIVDRAWRLHDLSRRAGQLQKLALLVNSAQDRRQIFAEIVKGAQELLDAVSSALLLQSKDAPHLEVAADTGQDIVFVPSFLNQAGEVARSGRTATIADQSLLVPLASDDAETFGVLVIVSREPRNFLQEEIELAETFASFATIALQNLRRRELEHALITQLQQTIEMRRDFVNSISHELRTPLACISGFSTTVLNHWDRLDEDTIRTSVEKIKHHGADLAELVERLLDFGLIEQGQFEPHIRTVDLRSEADAAVQSLHSMLAKRQVQTAIPDIKVEADPALLRRVFSNLLSNAVKASETDSVIQVQATVSDHSVRVEVKDEGYGIAAEDVGHLFEPFWRTAGSVKAAARGSGIGLTLVREYVRAMGGEIGVQSEPGKGAIFYFTLRPAA